MVVAVTPALPLSALTAPNGRKDTATQLAAFSCTMWRRGDGWHNYQPPRVLLESHQGHQEGLDFTSSTTYGSDVLCGLHTWANHPGTRWGNASRDVAPARFLMFNWGPLLGAWADETQLAATCTIVAGPPD